MASGNNSSFSIAGLGSGFADRQRDLFACLDAADKDHESASVKPRLPLPVDDEVDDHLDLHSEGSRNRRKRLPTKQFLGKESIFKRPEMPAPRRARNSVPDHQRNPHKYTKYTLGDVSPQDMSDRSNTATALSFLRELKARKESDDMDEDDPLTPRAIVFKTSRIKAEKRTSSLGVESTISTTESSEEADRPSFRSSKVVMPEYVVGQKKQSKKKLCNNSMEKGDAKKSKDKEITLGHLMDEEDA